MSLKRDQSGEIDALKAYSRGEISRQDFGERLGEPISFGELLMKLHEHRLPLPRFPSDRNSPGVQLIRRLAEQAAHDQMSRSAHEPARAAVETMLRRHRADEGR